jgi:hypothetical protein
MEDRAALVALSQPPWAATTGKVAANLERNPVYRGVGMRMIAPAEGLSACLDRALLFLSLAMMACWLRSTASWSRRRAAQWREMCNPQQV